MISFVYMDLVLSVLPDSLCTNNRLLSVHTAASGDQRRFSRGFGRFCEIGIDKAIPQLRWHCVSFLLLSRSLVSCTTGIRGKSNSISLPYKPIKVCWLAFGWIVVHVYTPSVLPRNGTNVAQSTVLAWAVTLLPFSYIYITWLQQLSRHP